MHEYAMEQMNRLLTTLAYQVHRAAKKPGPDEIHDLRVSVRRFSQGLQLFADFFPKWEVKKIRNAEARDAGYFGHQGPGHHTRLSGRGWPYHAPAAPGKRARGLPAPIF